MQFLNEITLSTKELISSDLFIAFTMFVALYFCIRLVFPQFRFIKQAFCALFEKDADEDKGISPFQAFMTALGSRVGVGNVAGVATAIATGGPGAICWIWIFGIFGSAVAVVEALLGQAYKLKDGDEFIGGPAYYIMYGLKNKNMGKIFGTVFAICSVIGLGVFMPGVQTNTVVSSIEQGFGFDRYIVVVVTAIFIALIIWGGIKRISKMESFLTPIKCIGYLLFATIVIVYYHEEVVIALRAIVSSALGLNPVFGGLMGSAVGMGVRRGLFSTDVGYGPGGTFGAAARCDHPVKQGLLQGLSVLLSTLIICTATALIILCSGCCTISDPETGSVIFSGLDSGLSIEAGAGWVQEGLDSCPILHGWAPQILAAMIAIFAVGTIIGYYYIIEANLRFLIGKSNKVIINIVKVVYVLALIASTLVQADFIWNCTDIGLGILGWINFITLLVLSPTVVKIFKDYSRDLKAHKTPVFIPSKYGIVDKTGAWDI